MLRKKDCNYFQQNRRARHYVAHSNHISIETQLPEAIQIVSPVYLSWGYLGDFSIPLELLKFRFLSCPIVSQRSQHRSALVPSVIRVYVAVQMSSRHCNVAYLYYTLLHLNHHFHRSLWLVTSFLQAQQINFHLKSRPMPFVLAVRSFSISNVKEDALEVAEGLVLPYPPDHPSHHRGGENMLGRQWRLTLYFGWSVHILCWLTQCLVPQ